MQKQKLIEGLRELELEARAAAEKYRDMIAMLEQDSIPRRRATRTAKLSDALVPRKRELSAKGRAAISRAAKKRWREFHAAKKKANA